jgi:hypothetical protein
MPPKNGEGGQDGRRNSGGVSPLIPESLVLFYRRMAKAFRSPPPPDAVAIAGLSRVVELHTELGGSPPSPEESSQQLPRDSRRCWEMHITAPPLLERTRTCNRENSQ